MLNSESFIAKHLTFTFVPACSTRSGDTTHRFNDITHYGSYFISLSSFHIFLFFHAFDPPRIRASLANTSFPTHSARLLLSTQNKEPSFTKTYARNSSYWSNFKNRQIPHFCQYGTRHARPEFFRFSSRNPAALISGLVSSQTTIAS